MSTPLLCILAFLAMFSQDIVLTIEVQAENRHQPVIAGLLDCVGFMLQVATYGVSIDTIVKEGLLSSRSLWVLAALTLANFTGTALGTLLGDRWVHAENLMGVSG